MVFIFNDTPIRDILDHTKDHSPEHRREGGSEDDDDNDNNNNNNNDPELTRDDDNDDDSEYMPVPVPYDFSPDIGEDGVADCDDDNDDIDDLERNNMESMSLQATAGVASISVNDAFSTRRMRRSSNQETVVVCGDPPGKAGGGGGLLEPHAKFFIPRVPRGSNRSVILFNPPL